MRCFIAVDVPEELKKKIAGIQQEFASFDTKLVEKKNLHFTLKFLGEINENSIKDIAQSIAGLTKNTKPFNIQLSGMGAFPSLSYIRVIWIGVLSDDFISLHKNVSRLLPGKPEKVTPHLTITRVRSPRGKDIIAKIVKKYENESFGTMPVDKITLKKSTLTPKGPVYEGIKVFELGR